MKRITVPLVIAAFGVAAAAVTTAPPALAAVEPFPSEYVAQAPAEVVARVGVEVIDPSGQLSAGDVEFLEAETARLDLPVQVERVVYLMFEENDDNLNDTVLAFARSERPDLISGDGDKWAPGLLMAAVGLDPNRMGTYAGDDVAAAVDFYGEGRDEGIIDEMRPPLQQGNWAAGLLRGVQATVDPEVRRDGGADLPGWAWIPIVGGVGVVGGGIATGAVVASRRKKIATAREQFDEVQRDYGRVGNDLTAIDVRAHSLTSPLANDRLRAQWEEVKDGFLGLHGTMERLDGLTAGSPDKEFLSRADAIGEAHEKVTHLRTAEENIETLARMEHGDAEVRRRQLTELHEDILAAETELDDADLQARLHGVDQRVLALRERLDDPRFMDDYADLLGDYRILVEAARERMYAASGVEADREHETPRLWESSWRPGYGYGNFVPFLMISTWHGSDVAAAQAASSSSVNTGYSAGGFSGAGASGSF